MPTKARGAASEAMSVVAWGAVADGITNDTVVIQDCIDNNDEIFFPQGYSYLFAGIEVGDNKTITGHPTLDVTNAFFGFNIIGSNVTIRDFTFSGVAVGIIAAPTTFISNLHLENIRSTSDGAAIWLQGTSGTGFENGDPTHGIRDVLISGCGGKDSIRAAITLDNVSSFKIDNPRVDNCWDSSVASFLTLVGIRLTNCVNGSISGGYIVDQGKDDDAVFVSAIGLDTGCRHISISNVTTWDAGLAAVLVSDDASSISITGNSFNYVRLGAAVWLTGSAAAVEQRDISITGNTIHGCGRTPNELNSLGDPFLIGGVTASMASAVYGEDCRNLNISGNTISYCSRGVTVIAGVTEANIVGNSFNEISGCPVDIRGTTGVNVQSNLLNNVCKSFDDAVYATALADRDGSVFCTGIPAEAGAANFLIDNNQISSDLAGAVQSVYHDHSASATPGSFGAVETSGFSALGFKYFDLLEPLNFGDRILGTKQRSLVFKTYMGTGSDEDFLLVTMDNESSCLVKVRVAEKASALTAAYFEQTFFLQKSAGAVTQADSTDLAFGTATGTITATVSTDDVTFATSGFGVGELNLEMEVMPMNVLNVEPLIF